MGVDLNVPVFMIIIITLVLSKCGFLTSNIIFNVLHMKDSKCSITYLMEVESSVSEILSCWFTSWKLVFKT